MEVEKFLSLMDAIRFDTELDETNPELRGLARKVYPYIRQIYNMMNEAGLISESKVNEVHGAKKHNAPKNERAAQKKGSRDAELETFGGGFKQKNKIHKPKNDYNRKDNKVDVNNINDNLDESVMKNTVKLNESELQYIVTESVKRILKEDYLGVDGAGKYFDSDDDYITVNIPSSKRELKSVLDEKMKSLGYEFSDSGANGDKIMLTYKRLGL